MNLYFDVSSILISFVLLVYFGVSKKLKSYQNGLFFVMIIMNLISSLMDVLKYGDILLGMPNTYIYTLIYYFSNIVVVLLMFLYVFALDRNLYSLKVTTKAVLIVPGLVASIILLLNPITDFSFYYENNVYHRGSGLLVYYIMGVYYFVATLVTLVINRKTVSFLRRIAIFVGLLFVAWCVFLQYMFSDIRMETFAVSFAQLILFFTVRNPMDQIDNATGHYNKGAFVDIMKHHFLAHTFFDLVLIALPEMKTVNYFDSEKCDNVLKQVGDFIKENIDGHVIYRVSDQTLAVEFGSTDEETIKRFMNDLTKRFKSPFDMGHFESLCRCKLIHIQIPEEIDNMERIEAVIQKLLDDKSQSEIITFEQLNTDGLLRKMKVEKTLNSAMNEANMEFAFYPVYSMKDNGYRAVEMYPSCFDEDQNIIDPDDVTGYASEVKHLFKKWEKIFSDTCDFINSDEVKNSNIDFFVIPYDSMACVRTSAIKKYMDIAKDKKVDFSKLVFFVSEYVVSKAYDVMKNDIEECRKLGVRFCVKDYGSGFTDIETIYGLKLDMIAISKNLVNDAIFDDRAAVALESVLDLAGALKMKTLLRGIVDAEGAELLKNMNCDYVMGDYYSELVNKTQLFEILKDAGTPEKGGLA